jgi:hypothetical protein
LSRVRLTEAKIDLAVTEALRVIGEDGCLRLAVGLADGVDDLFLLGADAVLLAPVLRGWGQPYK